MTKRIAFEMLEIIDENVSAQGWIGDHQHWFQALKGAHISMLPEIRPDDRTTITNLSNRS